MVVGERIETPALSVIAAVPPAAALAAMEVIDSLERAATITLLLAVMIACFPMKASVSFVMTSTSTPAPTPAVPPNAIEPPAPRIFVVSEAAIAMLAVFGEAPPLASTFVP